MREIEFRGKRKDNGEWIKGDLRHTQDFFGEKFKDTIHILEPGHGIGHLIIPETIGQYTGFKDKNGVKIFEGDIVKGTLRLYFDESIDWVGKIIFSSGRFCFSRPTKIGNDVRELYSDHSIEVIGNIHENTELLKKANNA